MRTSGNHVMQIREATTGDEVAIGRLAQLDSRPRPTGRTLVAEVDGRVEAALALENGRAVADPFEPTADAVALLKVRAAQMRVV
jgi:hypothetical protein